MTRKYKKIKFEKCFGVINGVLEYETVSGWTFNNELVIEVGTGIVSHVGSGLFLVHFRTQKEAKKYLEHLYGNLEKCDAVNEFHYALHLAEVCSKNKLLYWVPKMTQICAVWNMGANIDKYIYEMRDYILNNTFPYDC